MLYTSLRGTYLIRLKSHYKRSFKLWKHYFPNLVFFSKNKKSENLHKYCIFALSTLFKFSGPEGSRTPVRKPIHYGISHYSLLFCFRHSLSLLQTDTLQSLVASYYAYIRKALNVSFPTSSMPES